MAEEHDRVLDLLTRANARGESEAIWQALLHWLRYLKPTDGTVMEQFLEALLDQFPDLLRSDELAELFAYLHWRYPDFVRRYIEAWASAGDDYFEQLAGELATLIAFVRPELPWASPLLEAIIFDRGTAWTRLGAINTAVNLFPNAQYRERASKLLVRIIPLVRGQAWRNLFDLFRIVDEISPEPAWIALLRAIEANLSQASEVDATFVVDRLASLLPHEATLVARIAKRLIEAWSNELGDISTSTAGSAAELVDLAITLHRLGDETREIGLDLFERLVEIQAYTARETLEQIDNRFRSRRLQRRQRLPRRRRGANGPNSAPDKRPDTNKH
ncbi:hypothetical protein GGR25_003469 [Kaistia hirudinis]|uniref:Uncharacterized protein n=1 Tax=Kaistia hirudinis TaxID=1293440 RepID=A0A840AUD0_9HYPH|nr:hypothetical protein [Kaistia hirudinis]MBB3932411.1 hypothetical protein [Kaistia hirudinis]